MGKFCRKCGSDNEATARFCESCGAEFISAAAGSPALQPVLVGASTTRFPTPRVSSVQPKTMAIIAGALFAAAIAGGLVWYLTGASTLSNSEAKARIEEKLGKRENSAGIVCVSNLPYDRSEIRVGSEDAGTQQWMNMLVQAGIFGPPIEQTSGTYITRTQLVYAKSASASVAIAGKSLCFADGLEVASIVDIGETDKNDKMPKRTVRWQAKLKNPAIWIKDDSARNGIANLVALTNGTHEMTTPFVYAEKHWQIDSAAASVRAESDPFTAMFGRSSKAQPKKPAESDGLWFKLTSLFSLSEAPGDVAKKFIAAVNNGDVPTMLSFYPAKLAWIKDSPLVVNLPQQSGLMGVNSVTVLSEKVSGDTAIVTLKLETTGGSIDAPMRMIKENGRISYRNFKRPFHKS